MNLILGNCLEAMRAMPADSVDSIVTDPPYGLNFMGKKWDHSVPSVEIWAECLRVLKPGGHLLAFAGTRTQHRMAVNIEDGGFEIRDMIGWIYGSGFPKSLDVGKAIDKAAGAEREVVGTRTDVATRIYDNREGPKLPNAIDITAPATPEAKQWEGWGTALKPSLEPITVARKPIEGTVAANVLEHGTGGINVDGCRVGTEKVQSGNGSLGKNKIYGTMNRDKSTAGTVAGRWPANFIHDGSPEVLALFPETANSPSGLITQGGDHFSVGSKAKTRGTKFQGHGDSGSAARFFYCAKTSKTDRNESKPAMPLFGIPAEHTENNHPTVKPTDLMRYLCRLVTPPGGVVLDPFMGSGSTGKAAILEGFDFIGCELDADSLEIARARIAGA